MSSEDIISNFLADSNVRLVHSILASRFNHRAATSYLDRDLKAAMSIYARKTIYNNLRNSEQLFGTSIRDQVMYFSGEFIRDRVTFINQYILNEPEKQLIYNAHDGMVTARNDYGQSAGTLLDAWKTPRSIISGRDDPSGMTGLYSNDNYGHYGQGIIFCDQKNVGVNQHVDEFSRAIDGSGLNNTSRDWENTCFGISTAAADERLLSRRIFRSNEAGEENGIHRNDARRHRRNIDRDISEGLNNAEMGNHSRGFNMSELYARLDAKNAKK